jgi:hypothetical protein
MVGRLFSRWRVAVPAATGTAAVLVVMFLPSAAQSAQGTRPTAPVQSGRVTASQPCDPIEPSQYCLLPFPDDYYTRVDPRSATGLEVNLPEADMPKNAAGVPTDPTAWDQSDGFSPGAEILTQFSGVDLQRSGAPSITDPAASLSRQSPILIVDADTVQLHPFWAELDANAAGDPGQQSLILRPQVNFTMGHRYIVAVRNLRDSSGIPLATNPAFASLRDAACPAGHDGSTAGIAGEVPRYQQIFSELRKAGIGCSNLQLAWDFTVASEQNIDGRMLAIRDAAFTQLGSAAPAFRVSSVTNFTTAQNPYLARQVEGTFDVPSFLNQPGGPPGSQFNYQGSTNGEPVQQPGNIQTANFLCDIPRSAVADGTSTADTAYPGHASLYGHGLFGSAGELNSLDVEEFANGQDFVFCATDEIGMASADIPTVIGVFQNFSQFETVPDRLQQGMLDELFLGRLMTSPGGFDSSSAFKGGNGDIGLISPAQLSYLGYSQGGILGGALTAVSNQFSRAVLAVGAMNYSTLINRSSDGTPFLQVLDQSYPDKLDQQLIFSLIQMLWDRADPDGYAQHMTSSPLPGTQRHQVLIQEGFGDHQVSNIATQVEARTIGAAAHRPALPGGVVSYDPFWGLRTLPSSGYRGSAIFMWYTPGEAPAPLTDLPPSGGHDPHEDQRLVPAAQQQEALFLETGQVVDVCGGGPCISPPATPGQD